VQELKKSGERVGTRIGAGVWKGGVDGFWNLNCFLRCDSLGCSWKICNENVHYVLLVVRKSISVPVINIFAHVSSSCKSYLWRFVNHDVLPVSRTRISISRAKRQGRFAVFGLLKRMTMFPFPASVAVVAPSRLGLMIILLKPMISQSC
jgi:hypothetical protein